MMLERQDISEELVLYSVRTGKGTVYNGWPDNEDAKKSPAVA